MKNLTRSLLAVAVAFAFNGSISAAAPDDGNPDAAWSGDGLAFTAFDLGGTGNDIDVGFSGVVDAEGSMYVAGLVLDANGQGRIGVSKRDALGNSDDDFDGGTIFSFLTGVVGEVSAALLPGTPNRIVVAATRQINVNDTDIVVCAFNADAGFNTAFLGANSPVSGCTTAPLQIGLQRAADILVQPDGKFIVAGSAASAMAPDEKFAYFARFNADGSVDNSFNSSPKRNADLYASHEVRAIELASNGKVVAVGSSVSQFAAGIGGLVMRLNANGTLDQTAVGGESVFGFDGSAERDTDFHDLVLEVDADAAEDAIVVTGSVEMTANTNSGLMAKLEGTNPVIPDQDFGTSGGFSFLTPPGNNSLVYEGIASHPCTGYVVLGDLPVIDVRDILVNGWSRDGSINSDFGTSGGTVIDLFAADQVDGGRDIIATGDGVYIAGFTQTSLGDFDFASAKLYMDSIFCNGFEN